MIRTSANGLRWLTPALFILCLVALQLIHAATYGSSVSTSSGAAVQSAVLLLGLYAGLFVISGLIAVQGVAGRMMQAILVSSTCAITAALFLIWSATWLIGRPLSADTVALLLNHPAQSLLHLIQSDFPLLIALFLGLMLICYFAFKSLQVASRFMRALQRRTLLWILLLCFITVSSQIIALHRDGVTSLHAMTLIETQEKTSEIGGEASVCTAAESLSPIVPAVPTKVTGAPVIVVLIESLRYDLINEFPQAIPFLRRLARNGVLFDKAYATSSHSDYTDLSIWYSRYPLRAPGRLGYPPDAPWRGISVFEYFKLHGYNTAYYSSQNEKWGEMVNWLKIGAMDAYFDSENFVGPTWENEDDEAGLIKLIREGHTRAGKVEDSKTLQSALKWIRSNKDKPFILGMNLQNTHYSYVIPEGGAEPFQPADMGFKKVYYSWPREYAPRVRNRYLNAVFNVDRIIAQFASELERLGLWDDAVVLIVGDNGEAFYEHGFGNHSGPMFEEVARTLAILKLPQGDARSGTVVSVPISHIDFVPLLLSVTGMRQWPGFQGRLPWERQMDSPVYMTVNAIVKEDSVLQWPWKLLVRTFPERSIELYNLESDPKELRNVRAAYPTVAFDLMTKLENWRACQIRYYADKDLHTQFQPPKY